MILSTPRQKVGEALDAFCDHYPLFANIALRWEIIEHTDFETMATDGPTLFYNREFVDSLSIAETEWVLLHEAGHIFLGHHLRLIGSEQAQRNEAFDLALNSLIRESCPSDKLRGMVLIPGRGRYEDLPQDQDAEFYHRKLNSPSPPQQPEDSEDKSEQQGDQGDSESSESSESNEGSSESSPQADADAAESDQTQEQSESGSASQDASEGQPGGSQQQYKATREIPKGLGEVLEAPALDDSPEAAAAAEGEWQNVVAESIAIAQTCGSLPGWLRDLGERLLGKSEIDWRVELKRFMHKMVPLGSSYSRPNRRSAWRRDIILPARRGRGGADGVIIGDTSGSIFGIIKDRVLPELDKILQTLSRSSVRFVQIDAEVTEDKTYTRWDLPLTMGEVEIKGGGGTDLDPALELIKSDRQVRWCVVITDMEWRYQTAVNPGVPTLWIVVGKSNWSGTVPFGQVIKVS